MLYYKVVMEDGTEEIAQDREDAFELANNIACMGQTCDVFSSVDGIHYCSVASF